MKVKELIKALQRFKPDAVVLAHGPNANNDGTEDGELNVVENHDGKPYLTHYGVSVVFPED